MAITQYYVDPAINADSGTGTIGDPFGDLQYALNTVTRDPTNGDQFNIKEGTAEVLAGSLTLATYGTPTRDAPLVIRGYTGTAGDGGIGTLNGNNGNFDTFATGYSYVSLIDLIIQNTGAGKLVSLGNGSLVARCTVHTSTYAFGAISIVRGAIIGCHVYNFIGRGLNPVSGVCYGNYVVGPAGTTIRGIFSNGINPIACIGNVIVCNKTDCNAVYVYRGSPMYLQNNVFINLTAGTSAAVDLTSAAENEFPTVINNIIVGWSGSGGTGIKGTGRTIGMLGYNAFYNNTTPKSLGSVLIDLGGDVALAADPFTDAANGDFSLTAAAKAALASAGWPSSYLGAHANTNPHITIGAIQQALATGGGGGGPVLGSRIIRGLGAV